MMRLLNKVSIVTGAGRGIGYATVKKFLEEGSFVVACDISPELVNRLKEELSFDQRGMAFLVDVTESAAVEKVVETVIDNYGRIDVLVNNAGITNDNLLIRMDDSQWFDTIETNINSLYRISKTFLKSTSGFSCSTGLKLD